MSGPFSPSMDRVLPPVLLTLTAVTVVDAVSFLALGSVFTVNMTGNVVFLGFAAAGAEGLSVSRSLTALIALTALAMGLRNATVRKLAVSDLTTTVLTLTLTGLAADSTLAGGSNPGLTRKSFAVSSMLAGAFLGCVASRILARAPARSLRRPLGLLRARGESRGAPVDHRVTIHQPPRRERRDACPLKRRTSCS